MNGRVPDFGYKFFMISVMFFGVGAFRIFYLVPLTNQFIGSPAMSALGVVINILGILGWAYWFDRAAPSPRGYRILISVNALLFALFHSLEFIPYTAVVWNVIFHVMASAISKLFLIVPLYSVYSYYQHTGQENGIFRQSPLFFSGGFLIFCGLYSLATWASLPLWVSILISIAPILGFAGLILFSDGWLYKPAIGFGRLARRFKKGIIKDLVQNKKFLFQSGILFFLCLALFFIVLEFADYLERASSFVAEGAIFANYLLISLFCLLIYLLFKMKPDLLPKWSQSRVLIYVAFSQILISLFWLWAASVDIFSPVFTVMGVFLVSLDSSVCLLYWFSFFSIVPDKKPEVIYHASAALLLLFVVIPTSFLLDGLLPQNPVFSSVVVFLCASLCLFLYSLSSPIAKRALYSPSLQLSEAQYIGQLEKMLHLYWVEPAHIERYQALTQFFSNSHGRGKPRKGEFSALIIIFLDNTNLFGEKLREHLQLTKVIDFTLNSIFKLSYSKDSIRKNVQSHLRRLVQRKIVVDEGDTYSLVISWESAIGI